MSKYSSKELKLEFFGQISNDFHKIKSKFLYLFFIFNK